VYFGPADEIHSAARINDVVVSSAATDVPLALVATGHSTAVDNRSALSPGLAG
jgi:hypothetical protein